MKQLVTGLLLALVCFQVPAQHPGFITGGLSLFVANGDNYSQGVALPALTIFPGFKIVRKKEFLLFAGAPASLGLVSEDNNFAIGIDLPVSMNIMMGYGASNHSSKSLGFLIGGGVGYHNSFSEVDFSDGISETEHVRFAGILMQLGVAFPFGKKDRSNGALLRLSWMREYPDHKRDVVGIGLIAWSPVL